MRFDKQLKAHAKINLFLYMSGYRQDGYHLLYSLMQSVELADFVRISVSDHDESDDNILTYSLSGLEIIDTGRNTVMDAVALYMNAISAKGYRVHADIHKCIPDRAGLGGGSADAAAALKLMNEAFSERLSEEFLSELALTIGADVPFALQGGAAVCRGIGEIITNVPAYSDLYVLLIKPDTGISTIQAYQSFDLAQGERLRKEPKVFFDADYIDNTFEDTVKRVNNNKASWHNDFEPIAFAAIPELSEIKRFIYDMGALYASMSGSGSTMYGCFSNEEALVAAYSEALKRFGNDRYFVGKTRTISSLRS